MNKQNITIALGGILVGLLTQWALMSGDHATGVERGELSMCNKLIPLAFQQGYAGLVGIKCEHNGKEIMVTSKLIPNEKHKLKELTDMIDKANGR